MDNAILSEKKYEMPFMATAMIRAISNPRDPPSAPPSNTNPTDISPNSIAVFSVFIFLLT